MADPSTQVLAGLDPYLLKVNLNSYQFYVIPSSLSNGILFYGLRKALPLADPSSGTDHWTLIPPTLMPPER